MDFEKIYNECNKYTEYNRKCPFTKQDIIDETYSDVMRAFSKTLHHEWLDEQMTEILADKYGKQLPLSHDDFIACLKKLIIEKVEASIKSHNHSDDDNFTFEALNSIECVAVDKVKADLKYSPFEYY